MIVKVANEIELAAKVCEHFAAYDVYKEVPTYCGRCDIVVKDGAFITCIETKMQFSTAVIYQALRNMQQCHVSYVCVPYLKNDYPAKQICKELGIGVLVVGHPHRREDVSEFIKPAYRRRITSPRLDDNMKLSVAGSQHNTESEFKVTVRSLERILANNNGQLSLKDMFSLNNFHYATCVHARRAIVGYINRGIISTITLDNGIMKLKNAHNDHPTK